MGNIFIKKKLENKEFIFYCYENDKESNEFLHFLLSDKKYKYFNDKSISSFVKNEKESFIPILSLSKEKIKKIFSWYNEKIEVNKGYFIYVQFLHKKVIYKYLRTK